MWLPKRKWRTRTGAVAIPIIRNFSLSVCGLSLPSINYSHARHLHVCLIWRYAWIKVPQFSQTCGKVPMRNTDKHYTALQHLHSLLAKWTKHDTSITCRWNILAYWCWHNFFFAPISFPHTPIWTLKSFNCTFQALWCINPYPTAFPYGNGMVLHFYQQQESSTTKTVHKVINKGLKTYV